MSLAVIYSKIRHKYIQGNPPKKRCYSLDVIANMIAVLMWMQSRLTVRSTTSKSLLEGHGKYVSQSQTEANNVRLY